MNNQNKTNLILFIANTFSDEQCARLLESFTGKISESNAAACSKIAATALAVANKAQWEESEHPRHEDGRFAPGGSGRGMMTKNEARKWDETGRKTEFHGRKTDGMREIAKVKGEIRKLTKQLEKPHDQVTDDNLKSKLVKAQRDLANWTRIEKSRRRLDIEKGVTKRVLMKKVKKFHDVEDEIDYLEEKYADRNPNSDTHGEVVFPPTKEGQKAKKRLEQLDQKRADLDAEIDWDKVAEYDDEEND